MLFSFSYAYTIVGNSVIEEDSKSKIEVYPATASSPVNDFTQTFELTNKTVSTQSVYVAYLFSKDLQANSLDSYSFPVYDWVENSTLTCNSPYTFSYQLNIHVGQPNPHHVYCYQTIHDGNAQPTFSDYNVTLFDTYFSSGNIPTKTVNIKNNVIVSGDTWVNKNSFLTKTTKGTKTIFYTPSAINFNAGETKKWRINYKPDLSDLTKKWEMAYYTGSSAACILNDTCTYVQLLDPWWDTNWQYKRQITITNNSPNTLQDNNNTIRINLGNSLGAKADANCDDVRIVQGDVLELDRNIIGNCQTDANVFFNLKTSIAGSGSDNNYYLYYGNAAASKPKSAYDLPLLAVDKNTTQLLEFDYNTSVATIGTNATWTGTGAYSTTRVNGLLSAAGFGDSNPYLNLNYSLPTSGSWTWEAWVYPTAKTTQIIFAADNRPTTSSYYFLQYIGSTQVLNITLRSDGITCDQNSLTAKVVPANTWSHIMWERDTANSKFKFYVNGKLVLNDVDVCGGGTSLIEQNITVGTQVDATADYLGGYLDSIKLSTTTKNRFPQYDINVSTLQPTHTLGAETTTTSTSYKITFNVYRKNTSTHLTGITADWNVDAYDLTGQNSPFFEIIPEGAYAITFSKLGYDSNSNFPILADSNKTYTIYLNDAQTPTTTISGNSATWTNTNQTITLTCDDNGGIGCLTTAYRLNLGTWTNYTIPFVLSTDLNHRIDYNSTDSSGNIEAIKTAYAPIDKTKPTTNYDYNAIGLTNSVNVDLNCSDALSGCKLITYKIDSGANTIVAGTSTAFIYTGTGHHTITYYSTDNADNNEVSITEDLNAPILLTIFYPKNEETLLQITEKWKLNIIVQEILTTAYTDLNADKNLYLPFGATSLITVQDINTNYFSRTYNLVLTNDYNLQPYLLSIGNGTYVTFKTIRQFGINITPLPNITLQVYKGSTLYQSLITDTRGEALALLQTGGTYLIYVYRNGALQIFDDLNYITINVTASTSPTIIINDTNQSQNFVPTYVIGIAFTPTNASLNKTTVGTLSLTQLISNYTGIDVNYAVRIFNNDVLIDTNLYYGSTNYKFIEEFDWNTINSGTIKVWVRYYIDGNFYDVNANYRVANWVGNQNLLNIIQHDIRADVDCKDDGTPCAPLLVVSLIIAAFALAIVTFMVGFIGGQASAIIYSTILTLFTYFMWVPIELTIVTWLIIAGFIFIERRGS